MQILGLGYFPPVNNFTIKIMVFFFLNLNSSVLFLKFIKLFFLPMRSFIHAFFRLNLFITALNC